MSPLKEFEMFTEIIFYLTFQCNYSVKYVRNYPNQLDIILDLDSISRILTEIQPCKDQYI